MRLNHLRDSEKCGALLDSIKIIKKIQKLHWVDEILAPHVTTAPAGIVPLLALDSYRCHMMKSVVNRIQALGMEVKHITGGRWMHGALPVFLCWPKQTSEG